MGKDRRVAKAEEDESLGKKADKFGKKGDGKVEKLDKSFSHQKVRHILVQKQSEAIRISEVRAPRSFHIISTQAKLPGTSTPNAVAGREPASPVDRAFHRSLGVTRQYQEVTPGGRVFPLAGNPQR